MNQLQLGRLGVDQVFGKFDQYINVRINSELIIIHLVLFVLFQKKLF